MFDLHGQVVLLTGAAGGLGTAIATAMAARGATLLLSDYDGAACAAPRRYAAASCRAWPMPAAAA